LDEFAQCYAGNAVEAAVGFAKEKLFGVFVCEGLDHDLVEEIAACSFLASGKRSLGGVI
jgi:hypothetical protein